MTQYTLTLSYDWDATAQTFKCVSGGTGFRPVSSHTLVPAYKGFVEGDVAHIRVLQAGAKPTGEPRAVTFVFSYEETSDQQKFGSNPWGASSNRVKYGLSKVGDHWQPLMDGGVQMGEHLKTNSGVKQAKWKFYLELDVETKHETRIFIWDPELIVDPYTGGGG